MYVLVTTFKRFTSLLTLIIHDAVDFEILL